MVAEDRRLDPRSSEFLKLHNPLGGQGSRQFPYSEIQGACGALGMR